MPKLTKEQLANVKYVSMADYYAKVATLEDFDDKLKFTTKYLLTHGMNGAKTDYSIEEAVHLARLKLMDYSKQLRDKIFNDEEGPDPADLLIDDEPAAVNPYAEDRKDDIENEFFMGNPMAYLKGQAEKNIKEIGAKDFEDHPERSFRENCERLAKEFTPEKNREILIAEDKGMNTLNIQARLEAHYRGRENFKKIENEAKPSWFTRTFGTRSNAGKNFDEVYAAFNNPNHALYGNIDALERATTQYIEYKDAHKGPLERNAGLALKEPKEAFATNLLKAIREQKQNDEVFKPVVGACHAKKLTQETVDAIKGPEPEPEANKDRVPLVLDLSEDEEDLDNSFKSENDKSLIDENEVEQEEPAIQ